jgi:hypothetical protein
VGQNAVFVLGGPRLWRAALYPALLAVLAKFDEMTPKKEYPLEKGILAATIKNLQDFDQALRRWNGETAQKAGGGDA